MLQPSEFAIKGKTYLLGKFPAITGREILTQYPLTALPKVGSYETNEALMLKIMGYVGVQIEGRDVPLMLTTAALVNNHVPDAETLMRLEWAMMAHNFESLKNGVASGFLEALAAKVQESIGSILTQFVASSSAKS